MRISDWSSDVCSSDLKAVQYVLVGFQVVVLTLFGLIALSKLGSGAAFDPTPIRLSWFNPFEIDSFSALAAGLSLSIFIFWGWDVTLTMNEETRSEEHTSELQSLMRISYAVFCLKKKKQ